MQPVTFSRPHICMAPPLPLLTEMLLNFCLLPQHLTEMLLTFCLLQQQTQLPRRGAGANLDVLNVAVANLREKMRVLSILDSTATSWPGVVQSMERVEAVLAVRAHRNRLRKNTKPAPKIICMPMKTGLTICCRAPGFKLSIRFCMTEPV